MTYKGCVPLSIIERELIKEVIDKKNTNGVVIPKLRIADLYNGSLTIMPSKEGVEVYARLTDIDTQKDYKFNLGKTIIGKHYIELNGDQITILIR